MVYFYLCSCLSTQFLYRTDIKATFNVKDNIKNITKNSITLTINTTRLSYDESYNIGWQNRSTNYQFPMLLFYNNIFYLSTVFTNFHKLFKNITYYFIFTRYITRTVNSQLSLNKIQY